MKSCFVAGTPVWTPQGSQAIETIKVGDIVLSQDVRRRQTVFRRVKQTFVRTAPRLLHLTLVKGDKAEKISTTPEHPFYVKGIGFVDAGNLKPGMVIKQVSSPKQPQLMALSRDNDTAGSLLSRWLAQVGSWITKDWMGFKATEAVALTKPAPLVVKSLTYGKTPTTVYNFEVEDTHTYVVGKSKALVHNANCVPGSNISDTQTFNRGGKTFELEQGDSRSGWTHIFERHVDRNNTQFSNTNRDYFPSSWTEDDIFNALSKTLKHGKETSYYGLPVFSYRHRRPDGTRQWFRATIENGKVKSFHPLANRP